MTPAIGDGFDRYGTRGAPLVIALHGAVANRKTWLPLARVLPPGIELWCPDLPGHGARRDEPFALASSLALVARLVACAAPRRVVVAGDSLGGYLALAAASCGLAGVAGVVAGGCTWSMTGWRGALARASDLPPRLIERVLGSACVERAAAWMLPRITDAETAREIVACGLRARARSESLRELAGMDVADLARRIAVPIGFVNGAFDWPTRAGERALLLANADATLALARTGHGVGFFAPRVFAMAIVDVVRRAKLGGDGSSAPESTDAPSSAASHALPDRT